MGVRAENSEREEEPENHHGGGQMNQGYRCGWSQGL